MGRSLLALMSDSHSNSTLGLCSPEAALPEGQTVALSKAQQWLWQCFEDFQRAIVREYRAGDRLYGVHVGDGPDMNFRTAQLHTTDPGGAVSLFVETIRPFRELCEDGWWLVRGTEAHGGTSGNLEELAARLLEATHYPADNKLASCWLLRLELAGVKLDLTHHGPLGRLPWTKANGLMRVASEIIDAHVEAGEVVPDLAVQGHNHIWADTGTNRRRLRAISLPCWQLPTSYGFRVSPRRSTDIGGALVICEDGRFEVQPFLYPVKMEARWASGSS
jgi:hypothetical protein